jgi:hypothetical protein
VKEIERGLTEERLEKPALEDADDALDGVAQLPVLRRRQPAVVLLQQLKRTVRICK